MAHSFESLDFVQGILHYLFSAKKHINYSPQESNPLVFGFSILNKLLSNNLWGSKIQYYFLHFPHYWLSFTLKKLGVQSFLLFSDNIPSQQLATMINDFSFIITQFVFSSLLFQWRNFPSWEEATIKNNIHLLISMQIEISV